MSTQELLNSKEAGNMEPRTVCDDIVSVIRTLERLPFLILMGGIVVISLVLRDL